MPGTQRTRPRRDRRALDHAERIRRAQLAEEAAAETARAVLARASARRDAAWRAAAEHNRRRAFVVLLVPLVPGAILVVLGTVVTALFLAGGVLLASWLALAARTWTGLGTREPAGRPGPAGKPGAATQRTAGLDEAVAAGTVTPAAADRLEDLISSLCGTLGLPRPR
ncbi:MAG: hypothetical protein ACRD0B_07530, partial [Acidimicrobiales bacterium]